MQDQRPRSTPPRSLLLSLLATTLWASACEAPPSARSSRARPAALERHTVPERGYDVVHYALDLDLLPETGRIEGSCTISLVAEEEGLAQVVLDLVGLDVSSVRDASDQPLSFVHADGLLAIELATELAAGEREALTVAYGGRPRTGLWFSGRRSDGSGPTQVFTQGESINSRGWFPCFDHPSDRATSEIRVTMPDEWISIAPGERIATAVEAGAGRHTDHWRMEADHPCYLMSLVAGEFLVRESSWEGTPLYFVAEPRYADWLEASFGETDEMLSFFSEYTGLRYPYSKYSQAVVDNFPWGGMENISATTLTPLTLDDELGNRDEQSHGLVAHEAAHQWFGDFLTCDDWAHLWLNEGFATYMTHLYFEETRGTDEMRARIRDDQEEYLEEDRGAKRRPTVWNVYKEPEDLFDSRPYQGAAARLHLLRFLLGDEVFRAGVRAYVTANAGRNVVTADLQAAMEKVSGRDLDTFFEQWIHGRGFPEISVEWEWEPSRVLLTVRQTQGSTDGTPRVFEVPVDVEVRDSTGSHVHRIELDRRSETFELPAREKPFYVRFDKHGWIPKAMTWRRTGAEWLAIANSDDDVNGRRDAVRALGTLAAEARPQNPAAHETYVAELASRLIRDSSPWVRTDAAKALGVARGLEARERLIEASGSDAAARVRVAALRALQNWGPHPELAELARKRFDERFSWATMGAAAGLVCSADPENAYGWISDKLFVDSPHDQLCGFLLEELAKLDDPAVPEQLLRWARDEAVHPTARAVAVRELAKQGRARGSFARSVEPLLEEENFRLRKATVEALVEVRDATARRILASYYPRAKTSGERRAIEGVLVGPGS